MLEEKTIYVFADFEPFDNELVGILYVSSVKGRESYSFEYYEEWLKNKPLMLDPDLELYKGRQYLMDDKNIFGLFADSCPDRWGRKLMIRREELRAKKDGDRPRKLLESDYLLGVYDESRMGGIRFKTDLSGQFLSFDPKYATPPWTLLRDLEHASVSFENEDSNEKWLRQLLAPGSSLGGARPKASVLAPDGSLWIAKFPSKHDDYNVGAWEMVVHDLALMCGLNVSDAQIGNYSKMGTTFLTKRFDREGVKRVHFSSAMTMLGKSDGADSSDGSSYLEIVSFLKAYGASPSKDIAELWKRIVFSMAVSNTDDHLRNHGFILEKKGWRLSPMYDVNPDIYGRYLSLNVDDTHSEIDFDVAVEAAGYYGFNFKEAQKIVDIIKDTVSSNWSVLAKKYKISRSEISRMSVAFEGK